MKNHWLERTRAKNSKYTVFLFTETPQGQSYYEPKPLAPEVRWILDYNIVVDGIALYYEIMTIIHLSAPLCVNSGDEVVWTFKGWDI